MRFSRHSTLRLDHQISRIAARVIGLFTLMFIATSSFGSDIDVFVVDRDGRPVVDVAVYAMKLNGKTNLPAATASAVMDQRDMQFVPHLLVVQTRTPIEFPNSDPFAHHVYSFSHPNKFILPMYKGQQHPPVTFEYAGVVSIGCNIHDHMLGYILVVDSTAFTKTDENGHASLSLDSSEQYAIKIWSPRIRDNDEFLTTSLTTSTEQNAKIIFSLTNKLNPPHGGRSEGMSWLAY